MEKLTEEQAIVLTGFADILMCDFGKFHEDVEKRLGHPVMTHEFPSLAKTIKEAYREDFLKLLPSR